MNFSPAHSVRVLSSSRIIIGIIIYIVGSELLKDILIFSVLEPYFEASFPAATAERLSEFSEYILLASLLIPVSIFFVIKPVQNANRLLLQEFEEKSRAHEELNRQLAFLQTMGNMAKVGGWAMDLKTSNLEWSDQVYFIHELPIGTAPLLEGALDFYPEHARSVVAQAFKRCVEEGVPYDLELPFVTAKGNKTWVRTIGKAMRREGETYRVYGVLQDITEQKIKDSEFSKQEMQFKKLVAVMSDGFGIIDLAGICLYANESFAKMLGRDVEEMMGCPITDFMTQDSRSMLLRELERRHVGRNSVYELTWVRKDATECVALVTANPLLDEFNEISGSFAVITDITQRKIMEAQLAKAKEAADKANEAKTTFLSRMSHELRTPLNAILGFSQVLKTLAPNDVKERDICINHTLEAGQHLLKLINDVLDVMKAEQGQAEVALSACSLDQVIRDSCNLVSNDLRNSGITLKAAPTHLLVWADPQRLRQVLVNLLSNAIKYNKPQGNISIAVNEVGGAQVEIQVIDSGVGIAPEEQTLVFEPFTRLAYAQSQEIQGSGIGLALTKFLVEQMKGTISINSEAGVGTIFTLMFDKVSGANPILKSQAISDLPSVVLPEMKVLVIEDDPRSMKLMEMLLKQYPSISLLQANTGEEGVVLAVNNQPDFIFVDLNLPNMNGFDVLEVLRSDSRSKHARIVAISADAMPEQISKAMSLGFDKYLTKPIVLGEVISLLGNQS